MKERVSFIMGKCKQIKDYRYATSMTLDDKRNPVYEKSVKHK